MDIEEVGKKLVDSAAKVHETLGPGLLESAYQACLTDELRQRSLKIECEVEQPLIYGELHLDVGYRIEWRIKPSNNCCRSIGRNY